MIHNATVSLTINLRSVLELSLQLCWGFRCYQYVRSCFSPYLCLPVTSKQFYYLSASWVVVFANEVARKSTFNPLNLCSNNFFLLVGWRSLTLIFINANFLCLLHIFLIRNFAWSADLDITKLQNHSTINLALLVALSNMPFFVSINLTWC